MPNLDDLYQHPHERGELTHGDVLRLMSDWRDAGAPKDVLKFLAATPPWCDLPLAVFTRTMKAASGAN